MTIKQFFDSNYKIGLYSVRLSSEFCQKVLKYRYTVFTFRAYMFVRINGIDFFGTKKAVQKTVVDFLNGREDFYPCLVFCHEKK